MPSLPTDTNDSPNYTPAQHADHHNDLAAFNNAYLPVPAVYQQDSEPVGAPDGSWWIDTDEPSQSGSTVGVLGYAQVTADQGSITTEVDLTGLSVTVTVGTSRRIKVTGSINIRSSAADNLGEMVIKEGGTALQYGDAALRLANFNQTIQRSVVLTPSSGSHTYKLAAVRGTGAGTLTMGAGANAPAFILVEDIGAA